MHPTLHLNDHLIFPSYFNVVDFLYRLRILAGGGQGVDCVCRNTTYSAFLQKASDLQETTGEL